MSNCHKCAGYQLVRNADTGAYEHCDHCHATGNEPGEWHWTTYPIAILIVLATWYFLAQFLR